MINDIDHNVINAKIDAFKAMCRDNGLKITPQRLAVYKALLRSDEHPSADMVFHKVRKVFPTISLDTVNRTLLTLNKLGSAFIVEGSGDAKRFDGNMESHLHFKCVNCKRIVDFFTEQPEDIKLPSGIGKKFKVLRKTIYMEGLCDLCND